MSWPRAAWVPVLTWDDDFTDVQDGEVYVAGVGPKSQTARHRHRLFAFFEAKVIDGEQTLTYVDWQAEPRPLFCCRRIAPGPSTLKPGEPLWIP